MLLNTDVRELQYIFALISEATSHRRIRILKSLQPVYHFSVAFSGSVFVFGGDIPEGDLIERLDQGSRSWSLLRTK